MKKPMLYTFGYHGWGNQVPLMKKSFIKQNMTVRGRSLRWIDTRIRRSVRANGFNGKRTEELLGVKHYAWIPEFGNSALDAGGIRIADFKNGVKRFEQEIEDAQSNNMDIILFCHCEDYDDCHRKKLIELIAKHPIIKMLKLCDPKKPEFPSITTSHLDLTRLQDIKFGDDTIRLPHNFKTTNLSSPFVIAQGTMVRFKKRENIYEREVKRVVPSNLQDCCFMNSEA
jgi:hypothetical protein